MENESFMHDWKKLNKFLTEAMGECWHECQENPNCFFCPECAEGVYLTPDFATWEGFGVLWSWVVDQDWWLTEFKQKFWGVKKSHLEFMPDNFIYPISLALVMYKFLNETKVHLKENNDKNKMKMTFIASSHVDITCWKCCTTFGLKENEYIVCPHCGNG